MTSTHLQGAIETRANVYFDGRCVSHTVMSPDGTKKSVGVILPSTLTFTTGAPERMEVVDGHCCVKLAGGEWVSHSAGRSFEVPGQSSFEIEVTTALHYICHFG